MLKVAALNHAISNAAQVWHDNTLASYKISRQDFAKPERLAQAREIAKNSARTLEDLVVRYLTELSRTPRL